jgi:hypothetical protein
MRVIPNVQPSIFATKLASLEHRVWLSTKKAALVGNESALAACLMFTMPVSTHFSINEHNFHSTLKIVPP